MAVTFFFIVISIHVMLPIFPLFLSISWLVYIHTSIAPIFRERYIRRKREWFYRSDIDFPRPGFLFLSCFVCSSGVSGQQKQMMERFFSSHCHRLERWAISRILAIYWFNNFSSSAYDLLLLFSPYLMYRRCLADIFIIEKRIIINKKKETFGSSDFCLVNSSFHCRSLFINNRRRIGNVRDVIQFVFLTQTTVLMRKSFTFSFLRATPAADDAFSFICSSSYLLISARWCAFIILFFHHVQRNVLFFLSLQDIYSLLKFHHL